MVNKPRIDEIRERLDEATPGPWQGYYVSQPEGDPPKSDFGVEVGLGVYDNSDKVICFMGMENTENCDFIASAPTDIAFLLSIVEEKDKQIAELEARIAELENQSAPLLNPAGEYVAKFAENHGISFEEAMKQPMVKARFQFFSETGM